MLVLDSIKQVGVSILMAANTLANQVPVTEDGYESTAEINSLLVDNSNWNVRMMRTTAIVRVAEVKQHSLVKSLLLCSRAVGEDSVVLPTRSLRLRLRLRNRTTRDTDKPEIQPMSEPESQHNCVFF